MFAGLLSLPANPIVLAGGMPGPVVDANSDGNTDDHAVILHHERRKFETLVEFLHPEYKYV
jgi:hypothetical protein